MELFPELLHVSAQIILSRGDLRAERMESKHALFSLAFQLSALCLPAEAASTAGQMRPEDANWVPTKAVQ